MASVLYPDLPEWPQPVQPALAGVYRGAPEDFEVEEILGREPAGEGEHLLLRVRKRGANSAWVADALAERAGVAPVDVGRCGDKDRHAVTAQWFSLPDPRGHLETAPLDGAEWHVVERSRDRRKLRRGEHLGNAFALRIVLAEDAAPGLPEQLRAALADGFPNYFGPQRFGRGGANLDRVRRWVAGGRLPRRGPARARLLSTARALLFNEVLAQRVRAGCHARPVAGDVTDESGLPTGPLWGRGRSPARDDALALEEAALAPYAALRSRLEHAGPSQDRRALVAHPRGFGATQHGRRLELRFELASGVFATSLLAAIGHFRDLAASTSAAACRGEFSGRTEH